MCRAVCGEIFYTEKDRHVDAPDEAKAAKKQSVLANPGKVRHTGAMGEPGGEGGCLPDVDSKSDRSDIVKNGPDIKLKGKERARLPECSK